MRQIEVINLETIIDVTAETSNVEILVQDYDAELVERFALEAQEAAIDAEESADIATAQASIATAQATIATTQAGIATTQAGIATTQAGNALTSANNAAASAAAAAQVGTSTLLTGLPALTNTAITATDSILQAFAEAQGQINARVSGTGTSGQVAFWNGTSSQTGSNNLFWDNTNGRLGVGTNTPTNHLHINAPVGFDGFDAIPMLFVRNTAVTSSFVSSMIGLAKSTGNMTDGFGPRFLFSIADDTFGDRTNQIAAIGAVRSGADNSGSMIFQTSTTGTNTTKIQVFPTGNLLLQNGGTFTDAGFRLDVNGTARVQGNLTTNLTAGSVPFIGASGLLSQDNSTLFWDNTNKRLGVGTNAPVQSIQTAGSISLGDRDVNTIRSIGFTAFNAFGGASSQIGFVSQGAAINGLDFRINGAYGIRIFSGASELYRFDNIGRLGILTPSPTQSLDVNGTGRIRNGVSLADTSGNVQIGTTTDAGFRLDVQGSTRFNGLSTIQGTTASDTAPLGSELATTGTGTNWAGTNFATGYTHTIGSTDALTTTLAAVVGTYYQITFTVTGRTTGSFVINYGGTTFSSLTATGAVGPRATSTATLEIVPTTDFNGTIVLSVRTIGTSSATTTFLSSGGGLTNEIRVSPINTTFFMGRDSGRRNTTGISNTFVGATAGQNNTTGANGTFVGRGAGQNNSTGTSNTFVGVEAGFVNTTGASNSFFGVASGAANTTGFSNSFFGSSSGQGNTTGSTNSFFGQVSGSANTTGSSNSFFGVSSGQGNTTGGSNSFFGVSAGLANTTEGNNSFFGTSAGSNKIAGANNSFFGSNAGRFTGTGTTAMTSVSNSLYLGYQTRGLNATGSTNEVVIGYDVVGLGSNTTVLGNTSTTHGRWYGSLLLGTTTNAASSILTMESTTQGVLFPRMTTTQKNAIASPATGLVVYDTTLNKLSVRTALTWETVTSV